MEEHLVRPADVSEQSDFTIGELVPFKGIWFRVIGVNAKRLVFEPTGKLSGRRRKEKAARLKAARRKVKNAEEKDTA